MLAPKYSKRDMMQSEFEERAGRILPHGLGLSVDVYSPDLVELVQALRHAGLRPDFLEVFKAATPALEAVQRRFPDMSFTYHGEGLWVTQPDFQGSPSGRLGVVETCEQIAALKSAWLNHECATKQIGGYSFGTYLPPLYTEPAARMAAENLRFLQERLDERAEAEKAVPALVLLEMPPLTYFGCGTIPIPDFFRHVTDRAACGLVLDIGHVWTVYRYTGAWREQTPESFARTFLRDFPMERVIEIHVAGLAPHCEESLRGEPARPDELPRWIDAHGAAIPDVLFDLLQVALQDHRLAYLKGIALEVDTKPIPDIVSEFRRFTTQFAAEKRRWERSATGSPPTTVGRRRAAEAVSYDSMAAEERASLTRAYNDYAELVLFGNGGAAAIPCSLLDGSEEGLRRYKDVYLPYELLHWGGDIVDMFPTTCAGLRAAGIELDEFVRFWRRSPRPQHEPFDFFLIKIERFLEFVGQVCASARDLAQREADELRTAYRAANEPASLAGTDA